MKKLTLLPGGPHFHRENTYSWKIVLRAIPLTWLLAANKRIFHRGQCPGPFLLEKLNLPEVLGPPTIKQYICVYFFLLSLCWLCRLVQQNSYSELQEVQHRDKQALAQAPNYGLSPFPLLLCLGLSAQRTAFSFQPHMGFCNLLIN